MFLSPLYCGSTATGYRRTANYIRGELTLSTALSVSGAAVDPDTYATHSRPVEFLAPGVAERQPTLGPRALRESRMYLFPFVCTSPPADH